MSDTLEKCISIKDSLCFVENSGRFQIEAVNSMTPYSVTTCEIIVHSDYLEELEKVSISRIEESFKNYSNSSSIENEFSHKRVYQNSNDASIGGEIENCLGVESVSENEDRTIEIESTNTISSDCKQAHQNEISCNVSNNLEAEMKKWMDEMADLELILKNLMFMNKYLDIARSKNLNQNSNCPSESTTTESNVIKFNDSSNTFSGQKAESSSEITGGVLKIDEIQDSKTEIGFTDIEKEFSRFETGSFMKFEYLENPQYQGFFYSTIRKTLQKLDLEEQQKLKDVLIMCRKIEEKYSHCDDVDTEVRTVLTNVTKILPIFEYALGI